MGAIFSQFALRALGFDECCVIECNHNNVLFGMLSKVHRCINKMHLILNGQTGGAQFPPDVIGDTYRWLERGGKIFANAMICATVPLHFLLPFWGNRKGNEREWILLKEGRKEGRDLLEIYYRECILILIFIR